MVEAAKRAGLSAVVMTEHLPLPDDLDADRHLSLHPEELETYVREVREAASTAGSAQVILGAEADWLPGREAETAAVRARARDLGVEVLLGSVHFLRSWAFDDPNNLREWDFKDVDAVWREYFVDWCDAARSGLFDVMAHPDLVKKFGHWPTFDARELYEAAADAAASSGVLVEISTAGLRKPVGELYPGRALLAAFRRAGVDVTVGSDAHSPDEVGFGIDAAMAAATAAGYERIALPQAGGERKWVTL
jgi:histidinol-phosphatase (PHP family)